MWATALKQADGFTRLLPTLVGVGTAAASFALLALALRTLPVAVAYAAWTGLETVAVVAVAAAAAGERLTAPRLVCLGLIAGGVVGLRLSEHPD